MINLQKARILHDSGPKNIFRIWGGHMPLPPVSYAYGSSFVRSLRQVGFSRNLGADVQYLCQISQFFTSNFRDRGPGQSLRSKTAYTKNLQSVIAQP